MKRKIVVVAPSTQNHRSFALDMQTFVNRIGKVTGESVEPRFDLSAYVLNTIEHAESKLCNVHENSDFMGLILPSNIQPNILRRAIERIREHRDLSIIIVYGGDDRISAADSGLKLNTLGIIRSDTEKAGPLDEIAKGYFLGLYKTAKMAADAYRALLVT